VRCSGGRRRWKRFLVPPLCVESSLLHSLSPRECFLFVARWRVLGVEVSLRRGHGVVVCVPLVPFVPGFFFSQGVHSFFSSMCAGFLPVGEDLPLARYFWIRLSSPSPPHNYYPSFQKNVKALPSVSSLQLLLTSISAPHDALFSPLHPSSSS